MALWVILLVFVVRCYHCCKAALRLFSGPWLKLLRFLARQCKDNALFRRILAARIPGRPPNNLHRKKATIITAPITQLIRFKEFLKLDPDSSYPVNLMFQGAGGGVLIVRNNHKLDIIPSTDTKNWKMQELSSDHCKSVPDDKGTCLTLSSQNYYLIGYPETKSVGVTLVNDGKSDHRTRWRRRNYKDVLPKENEKEFESSAMLQLWDNKYSFPPDNQLSLYFIINMRSDGISYELGSPHDAKKKGAGAFSIQSEE